MATSYNEMTNVEKLKFNILEKKYVSGIFDDDTLAQMVEKYTTNDVFRLNQATVECLLMKSKVSSLQIGDVKIDNSLLKDFWANLVTHFQGLADLDARVTSGGHLRIGQLLTPYMAKPYVEED